MEVNKQGKSSRGATAAERAARRKGLEPSAALAASTDAESRVARWRQEADQARRESENATRERLAQAARNIEKMLDRYLAPALPLLENGVIGTEEIQPVMVNLGNLNQKIRVLTNRMSANAAVPSDASIVPMTKSTDETGN